MHTSSRLHRLKKRRVKRVQAAPNGDSADGDGDASVYVGSSTATRDLRASSNVSAALGGYPSPYQQAYKQDLNRSSAAGGVFTVYENRARPQADQQLIPRGRVTRGGGQQSPTRGPGSFATVGAGVVGIPPVSREAQAARRSLPAAAHVVAPRAAGRSTRTGS